MDYKLEEIINIPLLQDLQEKLNLVYSFPSAIVDIDGKILTAVAWQDICTKFHRTNPECEKECLKSDQYIMDHLHEANPAISYQCPHGLVDNATPIIIDGKHLGNFFTGQFFLEKPDIEFFKKQAKKYGFDEKEYMEAVEKVPIWTIEKLHLYLDFINGFIEMIASIGLKNLKETKISSELKESEEKYRTLSDQSPIAIEYYNEKGLLISVNPACLSLFGVKDIEEVRNFNLFDDPNITQEVKEKLKSGQSIHYQTIFDFEIVKQLKLYKTTKSGKIWIDTTITPILDANNIIKSYLIHIIDITELKLAEETLKTSEEKYRTIFENIQDVFYQIDLNGVILDISPSVSRFSDYNRDELIGTEVSKYYFGEKERELFLNTILQTGQVFDYELRFINKSGDLKYTSVNAHICYDSKGNPIYIEGIMRDIHERKQAEEKLKESESNFRHIFDNAIEGMFRTSIEGKSLMANPSLAKMLGFDSVEDYLNNMNDSAHQVWANPEDRLKYLVLLEKQEIIKEYICQFHRKDGSLIWASLNAKIVRDEYGNPIYSEGFCQEITERIIAEEKLRDNEESLRIVFNNSPSAIYIKDINGYYFLVNQKFAESHNTIPSAMIGMQDISFAKKWLTTAEQIEAFRESECKVIENRDTIFIPDEKFVHNDGTIKWYQSTKSQITIKDNPNYLMCVSTDITERKLAEEELKKITEQIKSSEYRLKLAINSGQFGIWDWNIEENYMIWDNKMFELYGISENDFPTNIDAWTNGLHPEDKQRAIDECNSALNGEKDFDTIFRVLHPNAKILYLKADAVVIRNSEGKAIRMIGVNKDITQLKLSEEKLNESEKKFRNIFENAQEGIFQTNIDGSYISVNPSLAKMYGFDSPDELISSRLDIAKDAYADPNERNIFLSLMNEYGFVKGFEYEVKRKDGSKIWFYEDAKAIKDENGKTKYFEGFVIDITERKLSEEKLKESEKFVNSIANETIDIIYIFDVQSEKNIYINKNLRELLGYESDEVPDDSIELINLLIHPEDKNNFYYMETIQNWPNEYINNYEYRLKDAAGQWRWFSGREKEFQHKDGKIYSIIGIVTDITEKKKQEIELIKAKERAEASDNLKSAFLKNISHEIRTPFNGILGFLEFMQYDDDISKEEKDEYFKIINKSSDRLMKTINDIVEISQIQIGQINLDITNTKINILSSNLFDKFKPDADSKGLEFILKNDLLKDIVIDTDNYKLFCILSVFIDNAIKFTRKGNVEFGYRIKSDVIEFYVKDTGIGIRKEDYQIIFEYFMQADVSDTRLYEGSGLGLSIAKAYAELLNGKIWFESDVGKGSVFYFSLPYSTENIENVIFENMDLVIETKNENKKLNILIVEDDEISTELISINIKPISNRIMLSQSGINAIEICRKNPDIDLILMDIRIADISGYEATKQIRQFNKDVIIIAQTAFGLTGDREKAIEAGCNDYITKPIKKIILLEKIENYFK